MTERKIGHCSISPPLVFPSQNENKNRNSVIRAVCFASYVVTQLNDETVNVEFAFHVNFGGHLPRFIVNGYNIPNFNRSISHKQAYFVNSITLQNLTKRDGKLLGEILINQVRTARKRGGWKKRGELGKVGIDEFLYTSVAMRELLPRYPWFRALLHEIFSNLVRAAPTVTTALNEMKDIDAINLAKGLLTIILSNTEVATAVDHWINQNFALADFEKENDWMRLFFTNLAQFNLNTHTFGLKLRVFAGAFLSIIDVASDVYMAVYFSTPRVKRDSGRKTRFLSC